jgi:acyl-CoA dehydrogenase
MAGLVPAIHAFLRGTKNVDARDKPGHDGLG